MAKRVRLDLELPDELVTQFQEKEMEAKAREALVMELLREHRLSQGKAAEVLGLDRHALLDLMLKYRVPAVDLTPKELKRELEKPFLRS